MARQSSAAAGVGRVAVQRYYKVSASITFCGMTIFSKNDVGGGYAMAEEIPRGTETAIALQFAGGSWPDKAHGVNRLGYIREMLSENPSGQPTQAEYFGFMTSSAEKNFAQAKQNFVEQQSKPMPYSATSGSFGEFGGSGLWSFKLSHFTFPSDWTFSHCGRLNSEVQDALAADHDAILSERRVANQDSPNTFLNSMRQALRSPADVSECRLVYNGKVFRMNCRKQPDGVLSRVVGMVEEVDTGHKTAFQLWYRRGDANYLPVRIEYKAKPFLKLVFDTETHWRGPIASWMLDKENA